MSLSPAPAPGRTSPGWADREGLPPLTLKTLDRVIEGLGQITEDSSLPRNIRRGAQGALDELNRVGPDLDVKVAGTVGLLDELASDVNLPQHGRTALWGIISQLETLR